MHKFKLIRMILEYVERARPNGTLPPEFDCYDETTVQEHLLLCVEAGYIEADFRMYMGQSVCVYIDRLTWKGHDELDRLRKEGCGQ